MKELLLHRVSRNARDPWRIISQHRTLLRKTQDAITNHAGTTSMNQDFSREASTYVHLNITGSLAAPAIYSNFAVCTIWRKNIRATSSSATKMYVKKIVLSADFVVVVVITTGALHLMPLVFRSQTDFLRCDVNGTAESEGSVDGIRQPRCSATCSMVLICWWWIDPFTSFNLNLFILYNKLLLLFLSQASLELSHSPRSSTLRWIYGSLETSIWSVYSSMNATSISCIIKKYFLFMPPKTTKCPFS